MLQTFAQWESVSILLMELKIALQNMQIGLSHLHLSCTVRNLSAEPTLTLQLQKSFSITASAWGTWNIGGLDMTMRLHFSFPWKSVEKQTLFSNILLPSEELNQTFLPTHFCPWKQPASLTAKLGIHIHSIFLAFFAHSTGSHFTGSAFSLPFLLPSSSTLSVYLLHPNR